MGRMDSQNNGGVEGGPVGSQPRDMQDIDAVNIPGRNTDNEDTAVGPSMSGTPGRDAEMDDAGTWEEVEQNPIGSGPTMGYEADEQPQAPGRDEDENLGRDIGKGKKAQNLLNRNQQQNHNLMDGRAEPGPTDEQD